MLLMAAGPLLGISEVASCGSPCLQGCTAALSRDLRAFLSFHFGFDITFVVEIRPP
jgi:hypothetical protein